MKGKYLYGIILRQGLRLSGSTVLSSPPKGSAEGPQDSKERNSGDSLIAYRDLAAIVREAEFKDYETLPKEEVIKDLTSHQQTIEKIMENFGSILPVKFGTILKDEKEVGSVLEKGYSFLQEALRKMEAKIELDLVCFWDKQKAGKLAFKEDERVQKMQQDLTGKGTTTLEDKITLGKAVANYFAVKKTEVSSEILRVLKKEVVESCSHVLADVNILLNQAFLVKKQNEERFNHTLNKLDSKFSDLVNFRLIGPLPPYSFATVVINALDKEEIKKAKKLLGLNGSTESTLSKVEGLTTGGELNKEKIKKAYDKLVFKLHPDKGGDSLEFEKTTSAYKLLRKYAEYGLVGVYLYKWENQGEL